MSKLLSPSIAQTKFDNLKWPILAYGLIFGLYIAYLPGKFVWFSWHPLSMLVSFVVLASNASLIKKIGGRDNTMTHGYMMVLAVVISMFGWYVIHTNKDMSNKPHWTTLHAQIGVGVMLGYTGLAIFGAVALNPDWGIMNKNTTLRTIHKWTGRLLTLLSWVVCVLGLIKMQPSQTVVQILFTAPLLYFGFVTLL